MRWQKNNNGVAMQTIHLTADNLPDLPQIALTIGNYDGVHLGHQAMITTLVDVAKSHQLRSAVMIFEPQPREFLSPQNAPARLTALHEKQALLAGFGLDYLLVVHFDEAFRKLSARAFCDLLKRLNAKHLVLGDDFRFGHDRVGDASFLRQADFLVQSLPTVSNHDSRISSTAIRQTLQAGDLAQARELLGRDYAMMGKVVHGDKIGRTLDFPTANLAVNRLKPSVQGVFAVNVFVFKDGQQMDWQTLAQDGKMGIKGTMAGSLLGAVNVGKRPSVNGVDWRAEVHLPEFAGDLYGLTLQVVFLHYLHGERRYDGLDALKQGIRQDVADILAWRQNQASI